MAKESNQDIFYGGFTSLLEEQWQIDMKLKGGDSDPNAAISAHKLVLAARSKVFRKMLEQDECKNSSGVEIITLSEMKHEEVKALVQFLYSSDFSISFEGLKKHVWSLYIAANKYEIPHLRYICRNELISSLNLTNALDILELAQIPFDDSLNDAALYYIDENISKIASSDELKLFSVGNPNLIVEILKPSVHHSICRECGRRNVCNYCG